MTKQTSLDFEKIDQLRRRSLLTVGDMAKLLGVSRQTYYSWRDKKSEPRTQAELRVRGKVRALVKLVVDNVWPTPNAIAADPKDRYKLLLEELGQQE